jgi:hypothetical protein
MGVPTRVGGPPATAGGPLPVGTAASLTPDEVPLATMVVTYLVLVEAGKHLFFPRPPRPVRWRSHTHRVHRRAARFSHGGRLPG